MDEFSCEVLFPEEGWLDDALFDAIIREEPMIDFDVYPDTMPSIVPEETDSADLAVIGSPIALLSAGIIQETANSDQPAATQPVEVAMTRNENTTLVARKRTRKKNPDRQWMAAPNPYGRRGRLRCIRCRGWRQPCRFDEENLDEPCELCRKRGFSCTAADKTWGSAKEKALAENAGLESLPGTSMFAISRSPSLPPDLIFIDIQTDLSYLQYFDAVYVQENKDGTDNWILHRDTRFPLALTRINPPFLPTKRTSPLYRAAVLTLASWLKDRKIENISTLNYFDHFCRHAQNAISSKNLLALSEASWIIAIYYMASFRDFDSALTGFVQYSRSLIAIFSEHGLEGSMLYFPAVGFDFLLRGLCSLTIRWQDEPNDIQNMTTAQFQLLFQTCSDTLRACITSVLPRARWFVGCMLSTILTQQMKYCFSLLQRTRPLRLQTNLDLKASIQQARDHLDMYLNRLIEFLLPLCASKNLKRINKLCLAPEAEGAGSLVQTLFTQSSTRSERFNEARQYVMFCMARLLRCLITTARDDHDDLPELRNTAHVLYFLCIACFDSLEGQADDFESQPNLKPQHFEFVRRVLLWTSLILTESTSPHTNALIVKIVLQCIDNSHSDHDKERYFEADEYRRDTALSLMKRGNSCISIEDFLLLVSEVRFSDELVSVFDELQFL